MQGEAPPDSSAAASAPGVPFVFGRRQGPVQRLGRALALAALLALGASSIVAGAILVHGGHTDGALGLAGIAAGLLVSGAAVALLRGRATRAGDAIRSACPVCGYESTRVFAADAPTICGACPAYLEAAGLVVREVDERAYRAGPDFALPLRVIEALPGGPRFADACVICGRPARHRRAIAFFDARALAARAQESLFPDHSTAYSASRGKQRRAAAAHVRPSVRDLSFPVCGDDHAEGELFPVAYTPSTFGFSSYRAYKDFCALNGIASLRRQRRSRLSLGGPRGPRG